MTETHVFATPLPVITRSLFRIEVSAHSNFKLSQPYPLTRLYFLEGVLNVSEILKLGQALLTDPVTETFAASVVDATGHVLETIQLNSTLEKPLHTIEVTFLPGVTDHAAENLMRAAHLLGVTTLERAATGQRYALKNAVEPNELERLALYSFSNAVIQRTAIDQPIAPPFVAVQQASDDVEIIPLQHADDNRLMQVCAEHRLALNLSEMQAIRDYFQQEERDPTDAELEMLAQTWSEHCVHKTFKALIDYDGPLPSAAPDSPAVAQSINGLLRTYIRAATEKVAKPWLRSAFVDNAGIVAFDDEWDLAFKVETHNHPSALEPFGGANTGLGGVIRDILGVSARPIASTDILCFGLPDMPAAQVPDGVLHPQRIADGVVHGIEDYGNKMGIPTVNGAILYHEGYTANPLVFAGSLGLLPHGAHKTHSQSGDLIVVIGGRTGRDGLRGATFSSMEMDTTTGGVSGSAVQIGHPINEKQVQEVILRLRDEGLYNAITDCGAGGLSSAVGEMAAELGAKVRLEAVPLKYPGLRPWEIWLSEAQERMVIAMPRQHWARVEAICAGQDVEAACIGVFEDTGRMILTYDGKEVGNLAVEFLHNGIPQRHLKAHWTPSTFPQSPNTAPTPNISKTLLKLLAHPNIRSKEAVIRRYDHEVQGGTAVKPLVGAANHGPSDAAVIVPLDTQRNGSRKAVALSAGICPEYGAIDPYAMAWAAIDEALRNLVAVGADPDQVAILDNFCWGNPDLADRLGTLVRCAQGCYDAALAYGVPFISGKDSLNNEYTLTDGQRHAIPGTLLISALGIVPDVNKTVTMDLKRAGNLLFVIGETRAEMGGSHANMVNGVSGGNVPQPNAKAIETLRALHTAIAAGLVQACHDCSEGGIAVALAEMCIAGRLGAACDVKSIRLTGSGFPYHDIEKLFSETTGRFIVEVAPEHEAQFLQTVGALVCQRIGDVLADPILNIAAEGVGVSSAKIAVADLERAWRGEVTTTAAATSLPTTNDTVQRKRAASVRTTLPRALILHANGSNRDREAALACELAGASPAIVHVNQLLNGDQRLLDYQMLIVPGGFSYGDDLGAGTLWALDLRERLGGDVARFIAEGRPVLGICNGFQALVKSGLLPGGDGQRMVTLTQNESARFECRWVYLQANPNTTCLFTEGLDEPIYCPVAHGEGRLLTTDAATLESLSSVGCIALTYADADGNTAGYPENPNGSALGIAGLCNPTGNVFGLMPHPENHIFPWQHPRWRRGENGMNGLRLFKNGVKYA